MPLVAVSTVIGAAYFHSDNEVRSSGLALSIAAAFALIGRRRVPVWTITVTLVLALIALAVDPGIAPYTLLIPAAALFSWALFVSQARQLLAGTGAALIVVAAEALNEHRPGALLTAQHLAMLAVPILMSEALRTRRDYRSVLGERLALAKLTREHETRRRVQDERLRIARDLHDVVAHTLTTINVQASVASHLLDNRPEQARHALTVIEGASRGALTELRAILGVLRESDGTAAPREPTPSLDEVAGLVEIARAAGLNTSLDVAGVRPDRLPESVSRAAYRVVQESLTNAARHAAGANVHVKVSYTQDEVTIAVENSTALSRKNGILRPNVTDGPLSEYSSGLGILGMTERARALGGSLTASPTADGFLVAARLPYYAG